MFHLLSAHLYFSALGVLTPRVAMVCFITMERFHNCAALTFIGAGGSVCSDRVITLVVIVTAKHFAPSPVIRGGSRRTYFRCFMGNMQPFTWMQLNWQRSNTKGIVHTVAHLDKNRFYCSPCSVFVFQSINTLSWRNIRAWEAGDLTADQRLLRLRIFRQPLCMTFHVSVTTSRFQHDGPASES
jgi:hypothetical protein